MGLHVACRSAFARLVSPGCFPSPRLQQQRRRFRPCHLDGAPGSRLPHRTSSIFENPAGLIYHGALVCACWLAKLATTASARSTGGLVFFGNKHCAAGGLGIQNFSGAAPMPATSRCSTSASRAHGLKRCLLIWPERHLSAQPALGSVARRKHGRPAPSRWVRFGVGAELYDLTNSLAAFGGGVAYDLSNNATLAVDGALDRVGSGKTIRNGAFSVHVDKDPNWLWDTASRSEMSLRGKSRPEAPSAWVSRRPRIFIFPSSITMAAGQVHPFRADLPPVRGLDSQAWSAG